MEKAIREGTFREDLFYRVNTFTVALPPLRERIEDIPFLAEFFLQRARAKVNRRVDSVSPQALALLRNYSWPGNLRELENIIERAVVLTNSSMIEAEHLPLHVQDGPAFKSKLGFKASKLHALEQFERQAVSSYLLDAAGNISRAAVLAKIPRRTFHRLMAKHKLSGSSPEASALRQLYPSMCGNNVSLVSQLTKPLPHSRLGRLSRRFAGPIRDTVVSLAAR